MAGEGRPTLMVDVHQKPHDVFEMVRRRIEACRAKCECKKIADQKYDAGPEYRLERPIRGRERYEYKRREIAASNFGEKGYYIWFEDYMFGGGASAGNPLATGSASDAIYPPPTGMEQYKGYMNTLWEVHKKGLTMDTMGPCTWGGSPGVGRFHEGKGVGNQSGEYPGMDYVGQLLGFDMTGTIQGETVTNPGVSANWNTCRCAPPRWTFDTSFNGQCPDAVPPYHYRTTAAYGLWIDNGTDRTGGNKLVWCNYAEFNAQAAEQYTNLIVFDQKSGERLFRLAESGHPEDLLRCPSGWDKDCVIDNDMVQMGCRYLDFEMMATDVHSGGPLGQDPPRFYAIHCGYGDEWRLGPGDRVVVTAHNFCRPGNEGEEGTEWIGTVSARVAGDLHLDICTAGERNCHGYCGTSYVRNDVTGMKYETYKYSNAYGICADQGPDYCANKDSWYNHGPCPDNYTRLTDAEVTYHSPTKTGHKLETDWVPNRNWGKFDGFRENSRLEFDRWKYDQFGLLPYSFKRQDPIVASSGWECFGVLYYPSPYNVSCDPNVFSLKGNQDGSNSSGIFQSYVIEYPAGSSKHTGSYGYGTNMSFAAQWDGAIIMPITEGTSLDARSLYDSGKCWASHSVGDARWWCIKDTEGNRHPSMNSALGGLCDGSDGGNAEGTGYTPAGQINFWQTNNCQTAVYAATGGKVYFKQYMVHHRNRTWDTHYQYKPAFVEGSGPWNVEDWGLNDIFNMERDAQYGYISWGPICGRKNFQNYSETAPYTHIGDANCFPCVGTQNEETPSERSREKGSTASWTGTENYDTCNLGPYLQMEMLHWWGWTGSHGYRSWVDQGNDDLDKCGAAEAVHQAIYYEYDYTTGEMTNQSETIQCEYQGGCYEDGLDGDARFYDWNDIEAPHLPDWWPFKKAAMAGIHDRWQCNESNNYAYRTYGGTINYDHDGWWDGPPVIVKWPVDHELYKEEKWQEWVDACNPELEVGEYPEGATVIELGIESIEEDNLCTGWSEEKPAPVPTKWGEAFAYRVWGPPK